MSDLSAENGIRIKSNDRSHSNELRQLGAEVNRIASRLAELTSTRTSVPAEPPYATAEVAAVSLERVQSVIRGRRLRAQFFNEALFADPAWDLMLNVLRAELAQERISVTDLCRASRTPPTTALRWLTSLVGQELFVRRPDPCDGRRIFIELSPATRHALHRFFAEVGSVDVL